MSARLGISAERQESNGFVVAEVDSSPEGSLANETDFDFFRPVVPPFGGFLRADLRHVSGWSGLFGSGLSGSGSSGSGFWGLWSEHPRADNPQSAMVDEVSSQDLDRREPLKASKLEVVSKCPPGGLSIVKVEVGWAGSRQLLS